MTVLRLLICAVALTGFAACGGKTTKPTSTAGGGAKAKPDMPNPCAGTPINPCKTGDVANPCTGAVNPCGPNSGGINPCAGDTGASDPSAGDAKADPASKTP